MRVLILQVLMLLVLVLVHLGTAGSEGSGSSMGFIGGTVSTFVCISSTGTAVTVKI